MKFYSPLRYPGGKVRLAGFLDGVVNGLGEEKVTILEPYAGGAGASLKLLLSGRVSRVVINDLDPAIYSFWKSAVFDNKRFINKVLRTNIDIEEWGKQKRIYRNDSSSEFDLGFATFYLNRTNRSGILNGGPIGGMSQDGEWKMDARFNKPDLIERLRKLGEYGSRIKVFNLDGIELVKRLKSQKDSKQYLVFLDPPYIQKTKSLYMNSYSEDDHKKLASCLVKSKLNWVMTYDEDKSTRDLYKSCRIRGFSINHNAQTPKIGKEILINPRTLKTPAAIL